MVLPEEVRVVKAPVEAVEAPIVVPLIVPPVMVAPDEEKVLAVTASEKVNEGTVPLVSKVTAPVVAATAVVM